MKKNIEERKEKASVTVELDGNVCVLGVLSVEHYSTDAIVLSLKKHLISIKGEDMTMTSYYPDDMRIKGRVDEIKIDKREKK